MFGHVEKPETIQPKAVMIVDEADQCLEKILTFSSETGDLNGMYHLKQAKKCYFFSATMSGYFKELVSQVIGDYKDESFKSQYQLTNNFPTPYSITGQFINEKVFNQSVAKIIRECKNNKS